jgi:hypothetical protein
MVSYGTDLETISRVVCEEGKTEPEENRKWKSGLETTKERQRPAVERRRAAKSQAPAPPRPPQLPA